MSLDASEAKLVFNLDRFHTRRLQREAIKERSTHEAASSPFIWHLVY